MRYDVDEALTEEEEVPTIDSDLQPCPEDEADSDGSEAEVYDPDELDPPDVPEEGEPKEVGLLGDGPTLEVDGVDRNLLAYRQDVNCCHIQTREEEAEDARLFRETKDNAALNRMIEGNLAFVVGMAFRYCWNKHFVPEAIAVGNAALMHACEMFDERTVGHDGNKARLRTYARKAVRFAIIREAQSDFNRDAILECEMSSGASLSAVYDPDDSAANVDAAREAGERQTWRIQDQPDLTSIMVLEKEALEETALEVVAERTEGFKATLSDPERLILRECILTTNQWSLQRVADILGWNLERVRRVEKRLRKHLQEVTGIEIDPRQFQAGREIHVGDPIAYLLKDEELWDIPAGKKPRVHRNKVYRVHKHRRTEEQGLAKEPLQPCAPPHCHHTLHSRGLCSRHYAYLNSMVKAERITWEQAEAEGRCLPLKRNLDPIIVKALHNKGTGIKAMARLFHCTPSAIRQCLREGGSSEKLGFPTYLNGQEGEHYDQVKSERIEGPV